MSYDRRERAAVTEALIEAADASPDYASKPEFTALLRRAFEVFDLDASNSIDLSELRNLLLAMSAAPLQP